jgi:hypothetical protein
MPEETERTVVRTYVPAYQKQTWAEAAEELEMSQSEFVRTMVQAGRREFEVPDRGEGDEADPEDPAETDSTPGVDGLETRIVDALRSGEPLAWEELVTRLTAGVEDRADDCLQELQDAGRVRYSGRDGGYVLTDE